MISLDGLCDDNPARYPSIDFGVESIIFGDNTDLCVLDNISEINFQWDTFM